MLRQGGRPRARAHARRPARLRRARGAASATQARIRRKGALVVHRAHADVGGRGGARGAPARRRRAGLPARRSATCARWSPSSRATLAGASFFPADLQCAPRAIARALAGGVPRVHTGLEVHGDRGRARTAVTGLRTSDGVAGVRRGGHRRRAVEPPAGRGGGRRAPARAAQGPARAPGRRGARRALHPPQGRRGRLSGLGGERRRGPAGHHGARDDVGGRRARGLQPRAPRLRPLRRRRGQRRHARAGLRAHARPARAARSTRHGPACARGCPITFPPSGRRGAVAGLWLATGHEGAGVALGPVTGRLVAQLYAGEAPVVDPAPFSPDRFWP